MLDLPWTTETYIPYGEQPRIYDATGALVAVVGNAEVDKQDDWERNATAIVNAINTLGYRQDQAGQRCDDAMVSAIILLHTLGRNDQAVHAYISSIPSSSMIDAAIMKERERCAVLVENFTYADESNELTKAVNTNLRKAAREIRGE